MACSTILAELTVMSIHRRVTGETILGSIFESAVYMAKFTFSSLMRACQLEASRVVIEMNRRPPSRRMALRAILSELTHMHIHMTGSAVLRCSFIHSVLMAQLTVNARMLAFQWEGGLGMIEDCLFPITGDMTLLAGCTQLSLMRIDLFMTGETILRRAFECSVYMALFTSHGDMRSIQLKYGAVMIESGRLPSFGSMARSTVRAQTPLMRIILLMAGETILAGCL